MIISINQHTIESKSFGSFEEMHYFLEGCNSTLVIEKRNEDKPRNSFYILYISLNQSAFLAPSELNKNTFGVGISSYSNAPNILLIPERDLILLGLDDEVVGISLKEKSILFKVSLMNLPFHSFFQVLEEKIILIFYELGVIAVNFEGKEIWGYDRDILCESTIDRGKLILEFLDIGTIVINITDGKILGNNKDFI